MLPASHSCSTFTLHGTILNAYNVQSIFLDAIDNRKKNRTYFCPLEAQNVIRKTDA